MKFNTGKISILEFEHQTNSKMLYSGHEVVVFIYRYKKENTYVPFIFNGRKIRCVNKYKYNI